MSNTLNSLTATIEQYQKNIDQMTIQTQEDLEKFRINFLGSKGILKDLMSAIKDVPVEEKKQCGHICNEFKKFVEIYFEETKKRLNIAVISPKGHIPIDATLPVYDQNRGSHHPLSIVRRDIEHLFSKIGFIVVDGPEIEDDWHNFGSMNLPESHPARDMQDTFYLSHNPTYLLRTHTSSVQARVMESTKPPIRVICPGRVFRNETISARSHCFFHQVEGLYIDTAVSFADLKQTLYYFVTEIFQQNVQIRFRPSYFPFTEPSAEMDIQCLLCAGRGCTICKHTGWVEILGSGMVHPQVLENFKIDSNVYSGFAFGMGIERICQLKYRINDLRLYSQNDIRFLKQFTVK
ncbi:MAG: phenylalanine--tRNA ligase subunit alpha [Phycisphaerales bacterium]|nr:phenylalanine--tRNA ligase subunit alpha [Phycisphaerales bacterium]